MRIRLFWQLLATFAVLIIFGVGATAALSGVTLRQITERNLQQEVERVELMISPRLGHYYLEHDRSWQGVERELGMLMARQPWVANLAGGYVLFDADGQILARSGLGSAAIPSDALERGTPIEAAGRQVGTLVILLPQSFPYMGQPDQLPWTNYHERLPEAAPLTLPPEARGEVEARGPLAGIEPPQAPQPPWAVQHEAGRSFGLIAHVHRQPHAWPGGLDVAAYQRTTIAIDRCCPPGGSRGTARACARLVDPRSRRSRERLQSDGTGSSARRSAAAQHDRRHRP
jgi:hypothetical protein